MKKIILPLMLILGLILPCALPAEAASMSAFIDVDSYVEVGAEFRVRVRYESDADATVQAVFQYDSSVVTFVRADSNNINDTGGTIEIVLYEHLTSHKIDFYFKMNREAAASFSTQVLESYTINMEALGTPSASSTTTGFYPTPVPPTQQPTPTPTPTPTPFIPTVDPSATPSTPLEFMENGEMRFIAENIPESVSLPEGFEKTQYSYKNNALFVIKNQYGVIMLYATNIVGENGRFYLYNEKKDTLTPYMEFVQGANTYTFLPPAEELPESFTETTVKIGAFEGIPAYTLPDKNYEGFVLVYAFNKTAAPTFYLFDTQEGTLQRCVDVALLGSIGAPPTASPSPTMQSTPTVSASVKTNELPKNGIDSQTVLFTIVGVCLAGAIAAVVLIIVRNHRNNRQYETDNDVEYLEDLLPEASQEQADGTEEPGDAEPDRETENAPIPEPEDDGGEKRSEDNEDNNDDDDILHLSNHFPR